MWLFGKKSSMRVRRETHTKLHDIKKQFDVLISKASKDKFITYLNELKDKVSYSVNGNKQFKDRDVKKIFKMLYGVNKLLNHEIWNSKKIKKKLRVIDDKLNELLS